MEKEHIYWERRSERGVTPEYLDSTRESPLNSGRDRATLFRPRCPLLPMPHLGTARRSLFLSLSFSPSLHPAYLLSFLRGFCLRWKGNHGASRVTGPTVFFSSRGDQLPSLSLRLFCSLACPPFSFRFLPAKNRRTRGELFSRRVMTKSCTTVNCCICRYRLGFFE